MCDIDHTPFECPRDSARPQPEVADRHQDLVMRGSGVVRHCSRMEEKHTADSRSLAFGLIFIAWIVSLVELGFSFIIFIDVGLSDGNAPHSPVWELILLSAGPLVVAAISFAVLLYCHATIMRFLLLLIPVLLSVAEFVWMLMLWSAG